MFDFFLNILFVQIAQWYWIWILFSFAGLGGSLQKDLNSATQALEDVALESANVAKEVIPKEVFNPLAKFTKVSLKSI